MMTKKLQFLIIIGTISGALVDGSFGVFKWMDSQQDTDSAQTEWMARQDSIHVNEAGFHEEVIQEIRGNRTLIDSAIVIGWQNRSVIVSNKKVILDVIKADSSISKEEMMEMMDEYMNKVVPSNNILDLDFPAGWIIQPSTNSRSIIDHYNNR